MTFAPHAIIGAAAGTFTDNIWLAFLFGLVSHFVADFTPHLEPNFLVIKNPDGTKKWSIWLYVFVLAEFVITIYIFWLWRERPDFNILLAGAIGGLAPDFIANNPFLQKYRNAPVLRQIFWFHDTIHTELGPNLWFVSLLTEVLLLGGGLWLLLRF